MEASTEINSGQNVSIIVNVDIDKEITDVRNALVYDVAGANIILSQTDPPFEKNHIGRSITITHLVRHKGEVSRIGFSGKVINVLHDYKHTSSTVVTAIVVKREREISKYDLRFHYRVKPKSDSNMALYIGTEKCNLLDISLGGARFSHDKNQPLESGNIINVRLVIDNNKFDIEAKTIRVWLSSETAEYRDMEYASVQFLSIDKNIINTLSQKIMMIQRKSLPQNK